MKKYFLNLLRNNTPNFYNACKNTVFNYLLQIPEVAIDKIILQRLDLVENFIMIGANDGITNDHIYKHVKNGSWKGILVEPIKDAFQELVTNVGDNPNLTLENVAIATYDGSIEMFKDANGNNQTSSIIESHVYKHNAKKVVKENVQCVTFSSLVKKNNLSKVDLLIIDTEGYDLEILRMIDFKSLELPFIIFEHAHVESTISYFKWLRKFRNLGYVLYRSGMDTIAVNARSNT